MVLRKDLKQVRAKGTEVRGQNLSDNFTMLWTLEERDEGFKMTMGCQG